MHLRNCWACVRQQQHTGALLLPLGRVTTGPHLLGDGGDELLLGPAVVAAHEQLGAGQAVAQAHQHVREAPEAVYLHRRQLLPRPARARLGSAVPPARQVHPSHTPDSRNLPSRRTQRRVIPMQLGCAQAESTLVLPAIALHLAPRHPVCELQLFD